jgi:predicted dehydrogenase
MPIDDPSPTPDLPEALAPVRRIAIQGLGRAGLAYAAAVAQHPACALAGFVEPRAELRAFAKAVGFAVPSAATLPKLLALSPADTLVVCVPLADRVAAAEGAIEAGLALLIDGAPAPHAEGAARLAASAAAARASIACATPVLFHPLFARAARLLAQGALGGTGRVRASVYVSRVFAPGAPPAEGDVLDVVGGELLQLLDGLFGAPARLTASGQRLYGDRLDEFHADLTLGDGIVAGVDGSWSVPGYPHAAYVIEAEGEQGRILVSDDALEVDLLRPCDGFPAGTTRQVLADMADPVVFDMGDPSRVLEALLARLDAGAVAGDALDAMRALRVVRAIAALRRSIAAAGEAQELSV